MSSQRRTYLPINIRHYPAKEHKLLHGEIAKLRTKITVLEKERAELRKEISIVHQITNRAEDYVNDLLEQAVGSEEELTKWNQRVAENEQYCLELENFADSLKTEVGLAQLRLQESNTEASHPSPSSECLTGSTRSVNPSDFSPGYPTTPGYHLTVDVLDDLKDSPRSAAKALQTTSPIAMSIDLLHAQQLNCCPMGAAPFGGHHQYNMARHEHIIDFMAFKAPTHTELLTSATSTFSLSHRAMILLL
jgi:hypothetical protein